MENKKNRFTNQSITPAGPFFSYVITRNSDNVEILLEITIVVERMLDKKFEKFIDAQIKNVEDFIDYRNKSGKITIKSTDFYNNKALSVQELDLIFIENQ